MDLIDADGRVEGVALLPDGRTIRYGRRQAHDARGISGRQLTAQGIGI